MKINKKHWFSVVPLLILIVFLMYLQKDHYSYLTENSINELKNKENIEILDYKIVNDVKEPFAYVFYKKENKLGSYIVRVIDNKPVYNIDFSINEDTADEIQAFGVSTGYPYAMIRINDEKILGNGEFIRFSFGNEKEYQVTLKDNKREYMFVGSYNEGYNQSASLEVIDKNSNIIYQDW
jgi:hypothetical protein